MLEPLPSSTLEIRSTVTEDGELLVSLDQAPLRPPGDDEVMVRMEAAPINPSDLFMLLGTVDMETLRYADAKLRGRIQPERLGEMRNRLNQSLVIGNEGAGAVIAAGTSMRALLGRRVATLGAASYAQYRTVASASCLLLPEDSSAADGASSYINPLTALCMIETMKDEGHGALIHSAATSNLGQMLNKLCQKDGVPLINIVRKSAQSAILRSLNAAHIVDSSSPDFVQALSAAIGETGATLAFDAIGGGTLASDILIAMERALSAGKPYTPYGSSRLKQVYTYGNLDWTPTVIDRRAGMGWSVGGWLLTWRLHRAGPERVRALKDRVAAELFTTFASHYSSTISLRDLLDPTILRRIGAFTTGEKYLLDPSAS